MKKRSTHISLFLTLLFGLASLAQAAPPILNYSGQVAVDGSPFTGTAYLKFAFVDGSGQFSYWSHDGTSANGSEPDGNVSVSVSGGLYSIMIGDTDIAGMGEIDEDVFQNHNDVHLRVWFSDGVNEFEQISPDRRFASVPYVLGNDGTGTATFMDSTGSGSGSTTTSVQNYNFGGPLGIGYARLVADGPEQPSTTLVLLAGDSAEVASYVADMPGRLEYAFDAYTIALPRGDDALLSEQSTLIGPGSVRLTAPTGVVNVAILKVNRASGRDPNKVQGSPAPNSTEPAPAPAIVSVPQTRSVARGGTTTLFVSASGDDLSYQWKKNGVDISGATSAGLPLQNATGADEGNYTVVISNSEGSVTSDPIVVAVKMPAVPTGVYRINNSAGATGHEVALTGFSIDQHEVTKAFWDEVYAWAVNNGYSFTNAGIAEGPEHPVHSVNWYDCVKWANALSERDGHTPCYYTDNNCTQVYRTGEVDLTNYNVRWNVDGYRLPTESEWEVAARGGLQGSRYAWGETPSLDKANFADSLNGSTVPIGSYPANRYGLYEIGGNLREWVWDWFDPLSYEYEFNETITSSSGYLNLIDSNQTTSLFWNSGYIVGEFSTELQEIETYEDLSEIRLVNGEYIKIQNIPIEVPYFISNVALDLRGDNHTAAAYAYVKYTYTDGSIHNAPAQSKVYSDWSRKTYANPNNSKLVQAIEIFAKCMNSLNPGFVRNINVFGKYPEIETYLTLNLPTPDNANYRKFKLVILGSNDDHLNYRYDLIGKNDLTLNFAVNNTNKLLELPEGFTPKRIKIYQLFGKSLKNILWLTNDPKSFNSGNQKVVRDNSYSENLSFISQRNFENPITSDSTVGFRLVQRP